MIAAFGNKLIFWGLLAGFIAIRGISAWIAHRSGLSASFEVDEPAAQEAPQFGLKGLLVVVGALAVFAFYTAWPEDRNVLVLPLPDGLRGLGLALGTISLAVQIWVHVTLQKSWLSARKSGKRNVVIAGGLYAWIRHPLYLALMLLIVSLSLVSGFVPFLVLALLAILALDITARKEEAAMLRQFGNEYRMYMERTGRFFPRLFRLSGPA